MNGAAILAVPRLKRLARPVAATKVEDSPGPRVVSVQLSAVSSIKTTTKHLLCFQFIEKTSPRNAEKVQIKNLGFFADCAAKKWPFGQMTLAQSAKKRDQRSAVS